MELRDQLRAVRPYWRSVLATVLVALGLAFVYNDTSEPVYESSMTFFAAAPTRDTGNALQSDQFAQQRINSYVGVVTSERLADTLVEDTGVDLSPDEVVRRISASADPDTVLLRVSVRDTSRTVVDLLARGIAANLDETVSALEPSSSNGGTSRSEVNLTVISGPTLAPAPVSPRTTLNLAVALLAGLALGLGQALVRSRLDTTYRSGDELARATRRSVLGVVRYDRRFVKQPILTPTTTHSKRAETIRQIRTNLRFMNADGAVSVIAVTSSIESEGKTTTATNLAVSFAESGRRTLLVDADLRKPRVDRYLDLEGAVGLTTVLIGDADLADVIQPWGAVGLDVLASGSLPPNPAELLGSGAMDKLLDRLRGDYDAIIIDMPPLVPVTDAAVVAPSTDGVILVVRHGHTRSHQVEQALGSLAAVDARVLGTVMTMAPVSRSDRQPAYYEDDRPAGDLRRVVFGRRARPADVDRG